MKLRPGINIEAWLRFHDEKGMNRDVRLLEETATGEYLVVATYEARGADSSDLMRPYRNTNEWKRLAEVQVVGKGTITKVAD